MKAALNKFSSFFLHGGLKETLVRFPLSAFCAFALFVLIVLGIHDIIDDDKIIGRFITCLIIGYFWFGGMRLVAESMMWPRAKEMISAFLVFVPYALLMALAEDYEQYILFIIPALLLFLMVAPYSKTRFDSSDDLSFWLFNRFLWTGVLLSFLAILIMTAGLHAAFASIEALFGVNLPNDLMGDIWAFSAILVGPVYALSFVPKAFEYKDQDECEQTPGLMFMLNWILGPLILIYFLILYAYFIKLLMIQELPLGVLAYMVTGFAGVGIATYLVGWPVREKAGALMQKFYQYFFPALIIPVILQFLAIGERIYTYGFTEQRYMVALSAVWLTILVVLFTLRKNTSLKVMPGILMMLMVLAAFGPWGAIGLSGISQYNRLENLLTKHEILQDGQIVKTDADIPYADRKSISSKVQYLYDTDRQRHLRQWFPDKSDAEWKKMYAVDITQAMGFQYVYKYDSRNNEERFQYYTQSRHRQAIDVRGYDYVISNIYAYPRKTDSAVRSDQIPADEANNIPEITWRLGEDNILTITLAGRGDVTFDLGRFVEEKRGDGPTQSEEEMTLEGVAPGLKIKLSVTNISGQIEDGKAKVNNIAFAMLLDL